MNLDPVWNSTLKLIAPDIDNLTNAFMNGPKVWAHLFQSTETSYCVQILEEYDLGSKKLRESRIWTTEQLVSWPHVTQISYNIWRFESEDTAKKFITLFELKWGA